jgi:hypothetical protein
MSLSEVDAIKKGVVLLTAHCIDGKKKLIWPCSFQQEMLVQFEEKILIFHVQKRNNLIYFACEEKFLA